MDESQTSFASQYPPYGFDIEMMKVRSLFNPFSKTRVPLLTHIVFRFPEVYGYRRWS